MANETEEKKLQVMLPIDLFKRLAMHATNEQKSMTDLVSAWIETLPVYEQVSA